MGIAARIHWRVHLQRTQFCCGSKGIAARIHYLSRKPLTKQDLRLGEHLKKFQLQRSMFVFLSVFPNVIFHLFELSIRNHHQSHVAVRREFGNNFFFVASRPLLPIHSIARKPNTAVD